MIARSIIEMRDQYPRMFCPQDWYINESFAHLALPPVIGLPTRLVPCSADTEDPPPDDLTDAVLWVGLYLDYPDHPYFHKYIKCADVDSIGQRVFIGGTQNGRGLEIHRVINLEGMLSYGVWQR